MLVYGRDDTDQSVDDFFFFLLIYVVVYAGDAVDADFP